MTRRRAILKALEFVVRTDFLIAMGKGQRDLSVLMAANPTAAPSLLHDLLRAAPAHIRDQANLPLTSLEDVVTLFDAQDE